MLGVFGNDDVDDEDDDDDVLFMSHVCTYMLRATVILYMFVCSLKY